MTFEEYGFKCYMAKEKVAGGNVERTLKASFLGVNVSSLLMLAYLKSWFKAYLYNKIGSIKSNVDCYGNDEQGYLSFSKCQKDGEVFLQVKAVLRGHVLNEMILNYQQVVMVEVVLNKAVNFLDVDLDQ